MTTPTLSPLSLHIWHIPLLPETPLDEDSFALLDKNEQARAKRFTQDTARNAYIAYHLAMRHILGRYLNLPPQQVALTTNEYKKPILAANIYAPSPAWEHDNQQQSLPDIRFNLSHCRNLALLAVTLGRNLGIDLEHINIERNILPLAKRYFSEQTVKTLSQLQGSARKYAFLRAWTQFEAYKKAQGTGLRGGEPRLKMPLGEAKNNQFTRLFDTTQGTSWQVAELKLSDDWVAAVVIDSEEQCLQISEFQYC